MTDPLSLILQSLKPKNEIFAQPKLAAPWGLEQPALPISAFHFVASGNCFIQLEKLNKPIALQAGDFVLLPSGSAHKLMSAPGVALQCTEQLFFGKSTKEIEEMQLGGSGKVCELICGTFNFDTWGQKTVLQGLGQHVIISTEHNVTVKTLLGLIYDELSLKQPGANIAANRLLDAVLIHLFREIIHSQLPSYGLFPLLQDKRLCNVLSSIHNSPEHPWDVEQLAALANLSRSAFSQRFKAIMQQSPMAYLNRWRIGLACKRLERSADSITSIAIDLGFNSSDVFIRNFKRAMHTTPERFRKQIKGKGESQQSH